MTVARTRNYGGRRGEDGDGFIANEEAACHSRDTHHHAASKVRTLTQAVIKEGSRETFTLNSSSASVLRTKLLDNRHITHARTHTTATLRVAFLNCGIAMYPQQVGSGVVLEMSRFVTSLLVTGKLFLVVGSR